MSAVTAASGRTALFPAPSDFSAPAFTDEGRPRGRAGIMAMTVRRRGKFVRVTTGCVTGDIVLLLALLAGAWAWIGLRAVAAPGRRVPGRFLFWACAFSAWPFTQLLRVAGWLPPRPSPLTGLFLSAISLLPVAHVTWRLQQLRQRQQREWQEQKAARAVHRDIMIASHPAAADDREAPHHCRLGQFNTARLDEHDMQLSALQDKCGEFLYYAREAAARAGIPPCQPVPERQEDGRGLYLVRGGEAS